jgi:hypothetical protein
MLTPSREHATRRATNFASPEFFYFLVRRYSDVSCSQVRRKFAAGRELLDGLIHVASEFRLRGGALFGQARGEIRFRGVVRRSMEVRCPKLPPLDFGQLINLSRCSLARSGTLRRPIFRRRRS